MGCVDPPLYNTKLTLGGKCYEKISKLCENRGKQ